MSPRNPAPTVGVPAAPPLPEDITALLRRLRMPHTRAIAADVVATAKTQRWDPVDILRTLLTAEVTGRDASALATRRATAGFPTGKTFEAWDPDASSIPAPTQAALRTLEWVHRKENLVICGPSGTGKTFFLEGLGQHAVETGLKVAWFTLEDLGTLLRRHRADDTVTKAIDKILRADLVRDCPANGVSTDTPTEGRRGRLVTDDRDTHGHEFDAQGSDEEPEAGPGGTGGGA